MRAFRAFAIAAACVLALQAPRAAAAPVEIPIAVNGASTGLAARDIASYPAAIDAIVRVFSQDLKLPVPPHTMRIYATREEFETALVQYLGLEPELAHSTAAFAKAAVGSASVLVNAVQVDDTSWPDRIELLAHELGHSVQLGLTGERPLNRLQWLTEGFAEWAGYAVTDRLGLDALPRVRTRLAGKLRERAAPLPKLSEMNTFAQWIAARTKYGFDATFSQSFFAVELLRERYTPEKVLDYFRQFQTSGNYAANFRSTFGESVSAFQKDLDTHLARVLDGSNK